MPWPKGKSLSELHKAKLSKALTESTLAKNHIVQLQEAKRGH